MVQTLKDSIREIIVRADECKADQGTDFQAGRLLAYNEVLSILKTDFIGEHEIENLLDFDIDARY